MARYWCERCKTESNTLSEPHLCKDLTARLKRRERQVAATIEIIRNNFADLDNLYVQDTAEQIVTTLAQMGVHED